MIAQTDLGDNSFQRLRKLKEMIDSGMIEFAGNKQLKIYGTLSCKSGKRIKESNRIFFASESEAIAQGYRPCGHCLSAKYNRWKTSI